MAAVQLSDTDVLVITKRVSAACRKYGFTKEEVEDITQDVFVAILEGKEDASAINNTIGKYRRDRSRNGSRYTSYSEDDDYDADN